MLVTFLFDIFYKISLFIVGSIPDLNTPQSLVEILAPVASFVGYMDTFVSLGVIVTCMAFILLIDNWNLVIRISTLVWEMLPFN